MPSIIAPPRNCWTVARADRAGLLVDASDYYAAFYEAALEARRYILMSGWQFDSTVDLLRGDNARIAEAARAPTALLPFLNHLCETRPALEIDILAWDFHVVLAFEREWMQRILFHWKTHERLRFHFDSCHPSGGCHHQKFVVIDGHTAFLGGIDLCEDRWDDRRHLADNPIRISRKKPQKPYHDVQAYIAGTEAVRHLTELFCERWRCAGAEPLGLPAALDSTSFRQPEGALVLPAGKLAFSRTDPEDEKLGAVRHVAEMFGDAIDSADRLIYCETQYFSSREIRARLERRMRDRNRPKLQIVVVVNARAEAIKEQVAVGLRQTENLFRLRRVAADTGHAFGCYFSLSDPPAESPDTEMHLTYIHTKLLVVDDRILSVGSANLTNRSMGLDTELQVTWDAGNHESPDELMARIRDVRVSLLSEHTGVRREGDFAEVEDLVARLDAIAERADSRLRAHPWPTEEEAKALELVDPQELPFDPAAPDESAADEFSEEKQLFRASLGQLWASLVGRVKD
jgi:phosphatidylserine/phosphatidylglycerophosphate/cardiolipin synthase-like enzyme